MIRDDRFGGEKYSWVLSFNIILDLSRSPSSFKHKTLKSYQGTTFFSALISGDLPRYNNIYCMAFKALI